MERAVNLLTTMNLLTSMKAAMKNTKVRNTLIVLYILAVLGFSASARANVDVYPAMPMPIIKHASATNQVKTLDGEVALATDGRVYLIVSDDVVYELRNREQDLASFNGQQVEVQGYEVTYKIGPVYQLSSFNPLLREQKEVASAPVLVVLKISELAL